MNIPWFLINALGGMAVSAVVVFPLVADLMRIVADPHSRWPYYLSWDICATIALASGLLLDFRKRRGTKNSQEWTDHHYPTDGALRAEGVQSGVRFWWESARICKRCVSTLKADSAPDCTLVQVLVYQMHQYLAASEIRKGFPIRPAPVCGSRSATTHLWAVSFVTITTRPYAACSASSFGSSLAVS